MTLPPPDWIWMRFIERNSEPFLLLSSPSLHPWSFLPSLDSIHSGIYFLLPLSPTAAEILRELDGFPSGQLVLAGGGGLRAVLGAEVARVAVHLVSAPADPDREGLGQQVVVDGGQHILLGLV